jgi:uncharacterized RDD family membrane protein YckC
MNSQSVLQGEYTIDTPENVSFGYTVADIGSRFIGALVDSALVMATVLALNIVVVVLLGLFAGNDTAVDVESEPDWLAGAIIAVYALFNFAIIWGYYILFEWLWHGQTPGKRAAGIQVVDNAGTPPGFTPVAIRNLVRIVDFLPFAYAVGLVTMFCNHQARRLGDYAAGTLVVKRPAPPPLETLASQPPGTNSLLDRFPTIRLLAAQDYQLIVDTLARDEQAGVTPDLVRRLARAVAARLQMPPPYDSPQAHRAFLRDTADAYRQNGVQS